MKTTCIDKLYLHLFIHIVKYIHMFLRAVSIICIRHTHPCVSTYVSMDIFIISHHLAIEAFRGSEPRISPRHLLGYGYFFFLGRKKPEKQVIFTSPYSRPFAWRRQRKLEISEEQDVSELHSLLPTRPPHQLLNGSCSVGKEAFQSDAVSELRQWWELTFITQEGPSTSWRCFPKSKNQIWILLFPQKVESMVVSFCWQRFSILTTCVCAAPNLVMDTEDVALN